MGVIISCGVLHWDDIAGLYAEILKGGFYFDLVGNPRCRVWGHSPQTLAKLWYFTIQSMPEWRFLQTMAHIIIQYLMFRDKNNLRLQEYRGFCRTPSNSLCTGLYSEEFLWACLGHVKFCKTYKDVNLIVASLVRTTGVVSTYYLHCCMYCSLKISIWQLFFRSSQC